MSVTERLMGIGQWDLALRDDTPRSVMDQLLVKSPGVGFGHMVVTPTHLDVTLGEGLLALARYTGVYRKQPSEFGMAGAGLAMWIEDEDGKGPAYTGRLNTDEGTFAQWVAKLRPAALKPGVTSTIGGSFAQWYHRTTLRKPLDEVCAAFGAEWVVRPNFRFDIGRPAELFAMNPRAVIVRRQGDGGRDYNVTGIVGDLDVERDLEDWVRRAVHYLGVEEAPVVGTANGGVAAADVPYRRPDGQAIDMDLLVEDFGEADAPTAEANRIAGIEYAARRTAHEELTVSSVGYDIGADVAVGDNVWVFDQNRGIYDLANPVTYRGQTIYPETIRCVGLTWPVKRGMGVYMRTFVKGAGAAWSPQWIDLTEYVDWEDGETTVEVGAKPRSSKS